MPKLTKIINVCIEANIFPSVLKVARVVPLLKNTRSRDDAMIYNKICILPGFSKLFEIILTDQIKIYVEANNLFYQNQIWISK